MKHKRQTSVRRSFGPYRESLKTTYIHHLQPILAPLSQQGLLLGYSKRFFENGLVDFSD